MSLALIQGYSSAEDEEEDAQRRLSPSSSFSDGDGDEDDDNDGEDAGGGGVRNRSKRQNPSLDLSKPPSNSSLPSALDVFAQVTGPPGYLSSYVAAEEDPGDAPGVINVRRRRNKRGRDKKDLPAGTVLESKAQLVGIRDRVRSDVEGSQSNPGAVSATPPEGKRVFSATNPNAEDAAELLRMCLQCGIPKTYSHTKGMVCPVCADRPPAEPSKESDKKKGSAIKDKEKSKRMRGQSSHATWKSETEMQLRQQFD